MSSRLTMKDVKKFNKIFSLWSILSSIIIVVGLCFMGLFYNEVKRIFESKPFGAGCAVWFVITGSVVGFHVKGQSNAIREKNKWLFTGMFMSSLILISLLALVIYYSYDNISEKNTLVCKSVLNDSSLHHGATINSGGYIIESADPVNVTKLSCTEYAEKKAAIQKSLLLKCDARLVPLGYGPTGQRLSKYLGGGDTNKIILNELLNTFFVYIDEKTYRDKEDYFYKATVCVAKRNTLDSLVTAALTKGCMKEVWQKMVTDSFRKNPTIQIVISLDDIFQRVYSRCPNDIMMQKIKAACGGSYTCDSVYFISGKYKLSDASKMLLESLFNELQRSNSGRFHINFYGYTDPHKVTKIPYLDNGSFSNINVLLPDSAQYQYQLKVITSNEQLSFARAYSCYDFMKKYSSAHITGQYTGGGESNNGSNDKLQRTVKIVIIKL